MSSPVQNAALVSPGLVTPTAPAAPASSATAALTGPSFADVLAEGRRARPAAVLQARAPAARAARHRASTPRRSTRLDEGVTRAAGKGSRDSVVLVDGTAFVVSVRNRTVITAVGIRAHARARVHQHRQRRDRMSGRGYTTTSGRTSARRPRKERRCPDDARHVRRDQRPRASPDDARRHRQQPRQRQHGGLQGQQRSRSPDSLSQLIQRGRRRRPAPSAAPTRCRSASASRSARSTT